MSERTSIPSIRLAASGLTLLLSCAASGCGGSPSKANIDLRKQNADLRSKIELLKHQREGDLASLQSLQSAAGSLPNLPPDRLDKLFTVHGLKLGRLTGGTDLDPSQPGDEGLKVYVVPTDEESDTLKAAGSFMVEAFDLGDENHPLIGRWTFDVDQARKAWYSGGLSYGYVLTCPWTNHPAHSDITLKVVFSDNLTRRQFTAQTQVKVALAPTTAPMSTPTTPPN